MRTIHKHEPQAWADFRRRADADFDDADAPKDELRDALVAEQMGLCCYCLARIEPVRAGQLRQTTSGGTELVPTATKIEHWLPRADRAKRVDYGNLLAACLGGHGQRRKFQHCDTAKADSSISVNPADTSLPCQQRFRYLNNGEIAATEGDHAADADITTLNLNHARTVAGRKALIVELQRAVGKFSGTVSPGRLQRMASVLEQPDGHGNLSPYCQSAIYWLRRRATKR